MLKKLLHEPLIHFLFLGGLLFFFYSLVQKNEQVINNIVVTPEKIEKLVSAWEKKSLRVATKKERKEIIEKEVYQTVLYREALKIGLENNDIDIKKHLVQKMEFIAYDTREVKIPSEQELKKFMLEHPKSYMQEGKISFSQSMMGGDTSLFEKQYTLTKFEASNIFGRSFAEALFTLEQDEKVHKIESDYGVHEILVKEKSASKLKPFNTVKEKLKGDYLRAEKERNNKEIYEALKKKYDISIEE